MAETPPPSMKPTAPFLVHAQQLEKVDPVMSYYCRYYAVQQGIKLRTANPDNESKKFLISIMDKLEAQKQSLGAKLEEPNMGEPYVQRFALRVFGMADDEDRAGNATKKTALNFYSASQFIEVLTQFGPLPPHLLEKQKYAKWKAADINGALKKGLKPKPGPPGGEDDDLLNENGATGSDDVNIPNFPNPPTNNSGSNTYHSNFQNVPSFSGTTSSQPTFSDVPSIPDVPSFNNPNQPTVPSFPSHPSFPQHPTQPQNGYPNYPTQPTQPTQHNAAPPTNKPTPPANSTPKPPNAAAPPQNFPPPQQYSEANTYIPSASVGNFTPSQQDLTLANKYAKFVVSSLSFDDVPAAVKNARLVLQHLTGSNH
eukprot:TRINITY_DN2065_c0_g1_i2.p1 TRINITY_DN2065_c0_g1~~TRINITY_DN2065_c0_g1_i2.p1  ORF type:complete len:368 (-),score=75.81 TRINITY_DN2065_c0_g1_i2:57-1160(-)